MVSLVLEGGSFRSIFSAGVQDALLDNNIILPYCIGVSAGISTGVSYCSRQPRRNVKVFTTYRNDKRYISKMNIIKNRSLFGIDFVYNKVPNELIPFDWDTYRKFRGKVVVVTTNALTGKPKYFDGKKMDDHCKILQATCALPIAFPPIMIKGVPYYDGGLSDPIPVRKAELDGCTKHIIVLTRPEGYVKECSREGRIAARLYHRKYPKISECLLNRHIGYNESVKYCEELERTKKAIILRPTEPIESFEKDVNKLKASYEMGYKVAMKKMDILKQIAAE